MKETIRRGRFTPFAVRNLRVIALAALLAAAGCVSTPTQQWPATPAQLYGDLFIEVQMARVFPDDKTFVDAVARREPRDIVASYQRERREPAFDLNAFVAREFTVLTPAASDFRTIPGQDVRLHIDRLWPVLTREPAKPAKYSSRLPLPHRYVVPGGRFNEMYYWDSYFTMLGLQTSGQRELLRQMCDNFAFLVERYGHIPNGNRSYYLGRSQPPFFALMVELLVDDEGGGAYSTYRAALQKEYDFWMAGSEQLGVGEAHRRVVRLSGRGDTEPLLGRSRDASRGVLSRRYCHGQCDAASEGRGLPQFACRSREWLGFQLPLVCRRQDAGQHSNRGSDPGRSEQRAVSVGTDAGERLRNHFSSTSRKNFVHELRRVGQPFIVICGIRMPAFSPIIYGAKDVLPLK